MEIKRSGTALTFPDLIKRKWQDTQLSSDMIPNERKRERERGRDRDRQRSYIKMKWIKIEFSVYSWKLELQDDFHLSLGLFVFSKCPTMSMIFL